MSESSAIIILVQEMKALLQTLFSICYAVPSFTNTHESLIGCIAQVFSLNSPLFRFGLQYETRLLYLPALSAVHSVSVSLPHSN